MKYVLGLKECIRKELKMNFGQGYILSKHKAIAIEGKVKKFDSKGVDKSCEFVGTQDKGDKTKDDGKATKEGLVCNHCKQMAYVEKSPYLKPKELNKKQEMNVVFTSKMGVTRVVGLKEANLKLNFMVGT